MGLAKAVLLPHDGMIDEMETGYQKITGRSLWDDADFSSHALRDS